MSIEWPTIIEDPGSSSMAGPRRRPAVVKQPKFTRVEEPTLLRDHLKSWEEGSAFAGR
jgi:hypothetical protein